MNTKKQSWNLVKIWNEQLTFGRDDRKLEKRNKIWASELGKDYYERYLKMNAVKPDFDYEERVLRKFECGNFFERIIGFVLISSGLLIYDNKWYEIPENENHLAITVKPDFIAGGKIDWDKAKQRVKEEPLFKLMPNLERIATQIVNTFSEKYPNGLDKLLFEIKSVNSQVFWSKRDYLQEAYPAHTLQCFAGMKATGIKKGRVFYISKDDLSTAEFPVSLDDKELNEKYETDIRTMTNYIRKGITPPKPESIVFEPHKKLRFQHNKKKYVVDGCYTENWEIGWSNYITNITGIQGKTQKEVSEKWKYSIKDKIKVKNEKLKDEFKAKL